MEWIPGRIEKDFVNDLHIYLIGYDMRWIFRRSMIKRKYPESFLSLVLDQEPAVKCIELENPAVTPLVMGLLYVVLEEESDFEPYLEYFTEALRDETNRHDMAKAAKYLLIPELQLAGLHGFMNMVELVGWAGATNIEGLRQNYTMHMSGAPIYVPEMMDYLLCVIPPSPLDEECFNKFVYWDRLDLVQKFVQLGRIKPTAEHLPHKSNEISQWLIANTDIKLYPYDLLKWATGHVSNLPVAISLLKEHVFDLSQLQGINDLFDRNRLGDDNPDILQNQNQFYEIMASEAQPYGLEALIELVIVSGGFSQSVINLPDNSYRKVLNLLRDVPDDRFIGRPKGGVIFNLEYERKCVHKD